MLINKRLRTNHYETLEFPGRDVTVIQLHTRIGNVTIFNIYNDCKHSGTLTELSAYLHSHRAKVFPDDHSFLVLLGDFNRHHPSWDDPSHTHLFTSAALNAAAPLIDLLDNYGMHMALPPNIPTLQHSRSKRWTRPDNVWCSDGLSQFIVGCDTKPELRGPKTDHVPIITILEVGTERTTPAPTRNTRLTDWDDFRAFLKAELEKLPEPGPLATQEDLDAAAHALTKALQAAIEAKVPLSAARSGLKRWWTKDLTELKKRSKTLTGASYKWRGTPDHPVHAAAQKVRREYARAILIVKRTHWEDWLDQVGEKDVWTANKYAASTGTDGGSTRIPTLTQLDERGWATAKLTTNEEKSELLAQSFFPPPPQESGVPRQHEYPPEVEGMEPITEETIRRHISALSPYKAPGPDGIQNAVLMQCVDMVAPRLLWIYRAILELKTYYDAWHEFLTVVLRKPQKPSYAVAKAYRPIALLCTMAKVLTAIIAEQVMYMAERHALLPKTQFGGRPGRTTTDAMHYLVDSVSSAWAEGNVVSILFLDISGAFPNAVPDVLIHDMRERRIPKEITDFVNRLLRGRRTRLKFDDYESDWFDVTNGIPQGDPLSLILYLFYGAGLLEIANKHDGEDSTGFVDDTNLFAIGRDFKESTDKLVRMFERIDGAHAWAKSHFSEFEITKFCLMHLTRKKTKDGRGRLVLVDGPPIVLAGRRIKPATLHKYLGVFFDRQLLFKDQAREAVERGKKYSNQVRRLTKINYGLAPKMNHRIYEGVVTKKMLYAVDVWCLPSPCAVPCDDPTLRRRRGTVGVISALAKVQRQAALMITGGLRSSPNDFLNLHANLLPMDLLVARLCHRAIVRMAALPKTHPLYRVMRRSSEGLPKSFYSPLQYLFAMFPEVRQGDIETITPLRGLCVPKFYSHCSYSKN